jgi:hypothetical protein
VRKGWMVVSLLIAIACGLARTARATEPQSEGDRPRVKSMKSLAGPLSYSNPAAQLSGEMQPSPKCRLVLLEVALGKTSLKAEAAALKLITKAGDSYSPIGIGGSADQIVPLDRLAVGRVVGMVLPGGAMFMLTKRKDAMTVSVDPEGVLMLLYDVPVEASVKLVSLGGVSIPVEK